MTDEFEMTCPSEGEVISPAAPACVPAEVAEVADDVADLANVDMVPDVAA
ncbi:hypothetical protein ACQEVF_16080 [Nonomuraea polychroma]